MTQEIRELLERLVADLEVTAGCCGCGTDETDVVIQDARALLGPA